MSRKHRSDTMANCVIAFSVSYDRENLLARGMGLEHLHEMVIRLARHIVRQGANLAYGGNWANADGNFTFDLLRLVTAEQEDNKMGGPDTNRQIGKLYCHSSWPHYLDITPRIEAQWINCCRIVRVTQQQAGLKAASIVRDGDVKDGKSRTQFNRAVTLSAMRRLMMQQTVIKIPDVPQPERVPPVVARILLGGKVDGYSGFLPGIFEEGLVTLEGRRPTYILGGFGGAADVLARAMLEKGNRRPPEFTLEWHRKHTPALNGLLASTRKFSLPKDVNSTKQGLEKLFAFVRGARRRPAATLNTGLNDEETRELLTTRDVAAAVRLVRAGLTNKNKLPPLPA